MDAKAETKDGASGTGGGGREWTRDLERPADETVESSGTIFDMGCEKESDSAVDISSGAAPPVRTLPVVFRWKGEAQTIFISGSYDNWKSKMPLVKSQDDFYTVVEVPEGANQYKFLIDGAWRCHPNEPMIDNGFGSQNNIITIKESDCNLCNILCNNGIGTSQNQLSNLYPTFCFARFISLPQLLAWLDALVKAYVKAFLRVRKQFRIPTVAHVSNFNLELARSVYEDLKWRDTN